MSTVRMCDAKRSPACQRIFSELEDGWSTMTGTQYTTDPQTGRRQAHNVEMDVCGPCNRNDAPGERTAIQGTIDNPGSKPCPGCGSKIWATQQACEDCIDSQ